MKNRYEIKMKKLIILAMNSTDIKVWKGSWKSYYILVKKNKLQIPPTQLGPVHSLTKLVQCR